MVADCPQRTYAILTKYDTLRSFNALKPAAFTPLQYENAQIYTNALMDSFMSYKALYKTLGEHIFNVQGKTLEFVPWEELESQTTGSTTVPDVQPKRGEKDKTTGLYPHVEDLRRFEASAKGLSDARKEIRRQMMRIVNEVDLIERDAKIATDEDHEEPFQSPVTFETRVPETRIPAKLKPKSMPLTGARIMAKTQTEAEQKAELEREEAAEKAPALYSSTDDLTMDEKAMFDNIAAERPDTSEHLRVSLAACASTKGSLFNNLDFVRADWMVSSITVEIANGAVVAIAVAYSNGLFLRKGRVCIRHDASPEKQLTEDHG